MKQVFARILAFTRKYLPSYLPALLIVGFVLAHLFFIENSYIDIYHNDRRIRSLQESIQDEQRTIETLQSNLRAVESDPAEVERIAREQYNMQRSYEDVFIVVTDSTSQTAPSQH